jgi:acetyltransferase-like isoleucine patch superfamily enzyme
MTAGSVKLPHDWFSAPLPGNVELPASSWLYSTFAFRHYHSRRPVGLRVGERTGLYNGTFFEIGPDGEVDIGDYCALVGAIIRTDRRVEIGDHVYVAHEVVMADTPWAIPPRPDEPSAAQEPGPVSIRLGANSWIGARAVLLGGTRVGEGAVVGAGAVVDFEVPDYTVAAGCPARIVGRVRVES